MEKYKLVQSSVGDIVFKRRKQLKLSQEQLAVRAVLSVTHISKIENGLQPTMETFFKICNELEIEIQTIFVENGFVKSVVKQKHKKEKL